jgi:hypothetical protein
VTRERTGHTIAGVIFEIVQAYLRDVEVPNEQDDMEWILGEGGD